MEAKAGVLLKSPADYTLADCVYKYVSVVILCNVKIQRTAFWFEFSEAVFMFTYASDCGDIISRRKIKTKTGKA